MNRRDFHSCVAGGLAALLVGPRPPWPRLQGARRVDGERAVQRLTELAQFGSNADGSVSRVAFSEADRQGRAYVMALMRRAGLETTTDPAGNLIGRRSGEQPDLAPIMLGSHIDSVPHGGNYDGQVGSMGAVEVAQTLADHNHVTRHPLEFVIFSNEEAGKTGSRAMSGEIESNELDLVSVSGRTVREGMRFIGGDPTQLDRVRRRPGDVTAFLELHVEQGGVLDREGIPIGVVEGIVGIKRWNVTVDGFANHAGTTPMDDRRDTLLAAARFVQAVNEVVRAIPGRQVATVGRIEALPGVPNVIPGRTDLSLEIRDLAMDKIDRVFHQLEEAARRIGRESDTEFTFAQFYETKAAPTDDRLRRIIDDSAARLDLPTRWMPSGAGHDAQSIAQFAPVGMIFVPSVGGISHSPREFSRPDDIAAGMNVLLGAVLSVDESF